MKLNWDKNLMIEARDNLLKKENLDEYDESLIKSLVKFYDRNIDNKVVVSKKQKELTDEEILEEFEYLRAEFIRFVKSYSFDTTSLINLIEGLKFLAQDYYLINVNNKKTTNQDLFDKSYQTFDSISPYLSKCLDYIYEKKLVKVVSHKTNVTPYCDTDIYNKLGYVFIRKNHDRSLESELNHELGHSIINLTNGEFFYKDNSFLSEFDSVFMELYTDRYLYEKGNNIKYLYSYSNTINCLKSMIHSLAIVSEISKIDGDLTKKKIEKQLLRNYDFEIEDFNAFGNSFLPYYKLDHFDYLIGACLSFNLFDKDTKDMKRMFTNSIFNEFNNNDEFFKSVDFDYKNPCFMCDIFNEESSNVKKIIRKLEKEK